MMHHTQLQPPTPPPTQVAVNQSRGIAVSALVVGIIAILSGWVPILGVILGIVAIVLGIVALKRRQPKGFGLTGLILGALAAITSIVMTITLFAFTGNLFDELERVSDEDFSIEFGDDDATALDDEPTVFDDDPTVLDDEFPDDDSPEFEAEVNFEEPEAFGEGGPIAWDAYRTEEATLSLNTGTEEDPHAIGSRVDLGSDWEIVINMVNTNAESELLMLAPENTPAEEERRYVLLHATVNNLKNEPRSLGSLDIYFSTRNQHYPPGGYAGAKGVPKSLQPQPTLFDKKRETQVTGNFSGYIAYKIKDVEGESIALRVNGIRDGELDEYQYVALK